MNELKLKGKRNTIMFGTTFHSRVGWRAFLTLSFVSPCFRSKKLEVPNHPFIHLLLDSRLDPSLKIGFSN
jgi:hypothetical protein